MDSIRIRGGRPLNGTIAIGGAKNAALPLMAVSLLTEDPIEFTNMPTLADLATMGSLLGELGVELTRAVDDASNEPVVRLQAREITATEAPYDLVRRMRASVVVMGPLLARAGKARVSMPGGCAIGTRPVDLHLKALEELGAEIELKEGYIQATAPKGLTGGHILFSKVSVGATENALMAAVLAKGDTVIANAAREPEIADLAHCLMGMGAKITGVGTDTLKVTGVSALSGTRHRVLPDRIETGTYAAAAAITGGELTLTNTRADLIESVIDLLERAGVEVTETADGLKVNRANCELRGVDSMTEPYPGFPTDMQAQIMAMMTVATGAAMITETIFENRFMHVPELCRMGADINVHGASAIVRGVKKLSGAPVMATDLRASVSLVLAGLAAEGETQVNRVYHLDRGYERLEEKLAACGADIARVAGD
ncbi:MAG: UDP-N-acetylglucosamine 1-carboxyvinyltransferase [Rhodospirillaceae bacterium]|nr:UDP-N-acetylglucosamine 1-carboxyvinyltransferase [Rhodospirillaceae bacterium]